MPLRCLRCETGYALEYMSVQLLSCTTDAIVTTHMPLSPDVYFSLPQVPAESGEVDDTGYDEAIVPTDMNLLTGLPCTHRLT